MQSQICKIIVVCLTILTATTLFESWPTAMSFPTYNMNDIYANLSSDEIFTPDQYAFNVSCLGCFIP